MEPTADVGIVFWILSFFILVSAFMVVSLKNVFHCALFLVICLFCVAGLYVTLEAEFLAAAQVLIYVGAIAILMIFAIMLTTNIASKAIRQVNENVLVSFFVSIVFFLTTMFLIGGTRVWQYDAKDLSTDNIASIGTLLMTKYMLPFEVVSVLLLAAMIGAIVLARKERA